MNVFTRGPALLAQSAAALADVSDGRFVLGLGASSNVIVEQWNGIPFRRPLLKVSDTIDYLRAVLAGERGPGGFKLSSPPAQPVPIVLAALRERMLRLAAEKADGVFANFLPLGNVEQVVRTFDRPDKELACRLFSIHGPEEEALVHGEAHVRRVRHRARLRGFLPLARPRRRDRSGCRGVERRRPQARARTRTGRLSSARSSCSARSRRSANASPIRGGRHRHGRARGLLPAGGAAARDRRVRAQLGATHAVHTSVTVAAARRVPVVRRVDSPARQAQVR